MNWRITGATLEGAMRMLDGTAPFARAAAILRSADAGRLLRVHRWVGRDAEGEELTEAELERLVASSQALRWRDLETTVVVQAEPYIAAWILRPKLAGLRTHEEALEDLRAAGAEIASIRARGGQTLVVAVREDRANPVRDEWATRAFDRGFLQATKGDWEAAASMANISFVMTRGLRPERIALYALALEQSGEKTDSEATLIMAEESRGKEFGRETRSKLDQYRRQLDSRRENDPSGASSRGLRIGRSLGPNVHKAKLAALQNGERAVA